MVAIAAKEINMEYLHRDDGAAGTTSCTHGVDVDSCERCKAARRSEEKASYTVYKIVSDAEAEKWAAEVAAHYMLLSEAAALLPNLAVNVFDFSTDTFEKVSVGEYVAQIPCAIVHKESGKLCPSEEFGHIGNDELIF